VVDARLDHGGTALGLRQDERTLQHGLRVQRQTLGRAWPAELVKLHRIGNVGFHFGGMTADAGIARVSNVGVGPVCLLNHRASETRELCNVTAQHCLAKIEVAEDAIKRILESVVGSGSEKRIAQLRPMIGGCDRERVLTRKVVKERTLRHAGPGAEFIDGRCRVALLADDRDGRVEKLAARAARRCRLGRLWIHKPSVPTSRYLIKTDQWPTVARPQRHRRLPDLQWKGLAAILPLIEKDLDAGRTQRLASLLSGLRVLRGVT